MQYARAVFTFLTFLLREAVVDPRGLIGKVRAKLGLTKWQPLFEPTEAELAEDGGEYRLALKLASVKGRPSQRWRNALVRRRVENELWWLSQSIATSKTYLLSSEPRSTQVLYVAGNSLPYTNSGYSKRTHSLAKAVQSSGVAITVLTRLGYPSVVGVAVSKAAETVESLRYERNMQWRFPCGPRKEFEYAKEGIVEAARRHNATILHTTTSFKNAIVVAAAAQELHLPWIYETRGEIEKTWLTHSTYDRTSRTEESEHYRLWRAKEVEAASAADGVVTLSNLAARRLIRKGIAGGDICVAPNSAEDDLFKRVVSVDEARRLTGVEGDFIVGTVTSVVEYEGLDTMIRALPHLPNSVKFLVVGDGTDRPRLEELTSDLGLSDRVTFVGRQPQDEIVPWYRTLDVFVVPRTNSPVCRTVTPIKPLAAMALGIPVVASDLPALQEVTGGLATYFEPENPEALAAAIRTVMRGPHLGRQAQEWAKGRTWSQIGYILRDFYSEIESRRLAS